MNPVVIVGAGLAGSEAAWQLAKRGVPVRLIEMRPATATPAHKSAQFAELVCSNSFRGAALTNAVGLLKEELKLMDSLIMGCALKTEVPAGGCLAVDRDAFSNLVTATLKEHPLITVEEAEINDLPKAEDPNLTIIATGPLTSKPLSLAIEVILWGKASGFLRCN
jgi:methylenetetrahydrofolate--tRNA-(uracil-5-)-methyltransferase